ncbi:hypothetical protein BDK51DRAFT_44421 [Blyttiomyces helicus]|uniref:Uncharacterized protein n=1 Tax=Blyttiomyces helicus TaxID=388810 RepID=A0A4P9W4R9_9FUNG|nr:hypothetical protein BDK51DRAFT_44421 [Blyttiomyces helicus]|eukprot:RKO85710.1 hypothetical protein BDK51DRAFT_44421 [Blyttiomyces helicus]
MDEALGIFIATFSPLHSPAAEASQSTLLPIVSDPNSPRLAFFENYSPCPAASNGPHVAPLPCGSPAGSLPCTSPAARFGTWFQACRTDEKSEGLLPPPQPLIRSAGSFVGLAAGAPQMVLRSQASPIRWAIKASSSQILDAPNVGRDSIRTEENALFDSWTGRRWRNGGSARRKIEQRIDIPIPGPVWE